MFTILSTRFHAFPADQSDEQTVNLANPTPKIGSADWTLHDGGTSIEDGMAGSVIR